jgi:PAS domain S-box-containing protein
MTPRVLTNIVPVTETLPDFDASGYLPVGIHPCSLGEVARVVRFNEHRRKMWLQLSSFLVGPVVRHRFCAVYFGGGFVSTKAHPSDIDLVLETATPYGPEAFEAVAPFFVTGLEKIAMIYGVHLQFWMRGAPNGLTDYRTFFQYARPDSFTPVHHPSRGIAKVDLTEASTLARLRRYIRGENTAAVPISEAPRPRNPADEVEHLRGLKRRLALMSISTTKLVILTDAKGRIEWVNEAFIRCCGYGFEEVRGRKPGRLLQGPASDQDTVQHMRRAVATASEFECKIINYRKNGTPYTAQIMLSPLTEAGKLAGFLAVEEDMGEPPGVMAAQWAA